MSNTHAYLTRRLGTLRAHTEATQNEINRLLRQREAQTTELRQVEAALAAVDGLTEPEPPEPEVAAEPADDGLVPECPICGNTNPGSTPSCDCDAHRHTTIPEEADRG